MFFNRTNVIRRMDVNKSYAMKKGFWLLFWNLVSLIAFIVYFVESSKDDYWSWAAVPIFIHLLCPYLYSATVANFVGKCNEEWERKTWSENKIVKLLVNPLKILLCIPFICAIGNFIYFLWVQDFKDCKISVTTNYIKEEELGSKSDK